MRALFPRFLLVTGFCLAAVGASGFGERIEPLAWPFFLVGLAGTLAGGLLLRGETRRRGREGGGSDSSSRAALAKELAGIARAVARLDDEKETVTRPDFCARIDDLLRGACFELGRRNEHWARLLGPATFARIWDGFAISERLLARAWSMGTDDHLEEAHAELARARRHIASAAAAAEDGDSPTRPGPRRG